MPSATFCKTVVGPLIPRQITGCHLGIDMAKQDRLELRFVEAVQEEFRFLETHGYKCVWVEPTFIKYELGGFFVNVYHGRSSFELGVEIGQMNQADENGTGYSLTELLQFCAPEKKDRWYFAARTPADVKTGVGRMAEAFKQCSDLILSGSPAVFDQLREQRKKWKYSFALDVLAKQTRPKAEMAFQKKRYAEAAKLYESIRAALTPTELKKLEYARRHIG